MSVSYTRHVRPAPHFKLIIGREEGENQYLEGYRNQFTCLRPMSHRGPLCIIDGDGLTADDLRLAGRILGRYSQTKDGEAFTLELTHPGGQGEVIQTTSLPGPEIKPSWHV